MILTKKIREDAGKYDSLLLEQCHNILNGKDEPIQPYIDNIERIRSNMDKDLSVSEEVKQAYTKFYRHIRDIYDGKAGHRRT